ncbi:MAG: glycerol-3-phosphate acyltransferase [Elusimicrobia bacterium]|nr:glycerol-3-phosphate acyltransferase [Elusimicrobiota bacterium]
MIGNLFMVAGAYFLGSIPTAYLMGWALRGIDIRTVGSGNVGATNVFRTIGKRAGVATLLIDMAKGLLAVELALIYRGGDFWPLVAGVAVVAGHSWSLWVNFRGGKASPRRRGFPCAFPGPMGLALLVLP